MAAPANSIHRDNITLFFSISSMEDKIEDNKTILFQDPADLTKWNALKIAQWFPVLGVISSIYQIGTMRHIFLSDDEHISTKIAFIARLILSIVAPILFLIDLAGTLIKKCWHGNDEDTVNQQNNNNTNTQLPDIKNVNLQDHMY